MSYIAIPCPTKNPEKKEKKMASTPVKISALCKVSLVSASSASKRSPKQSDLLK